MNKEKKIQAQMDESREKQKAEDCAPGTDVYASVKHRESESGVEIPTEEAVHEAKEWSEQNKQ